MHKNTAIGLQYEQPGGERKMGAETTGVIDGASGYDKTHAGA